jgi:hypothetical protein
MQKQERKPLVRKAIAMMGFLGVLAVVASVSLKPKPDIQGESTGTDPKIGEVRYMGASNCDRAIKTQLSDPDSFQRVATQIVDVKPGSGWVAETSFRSRNGFGGYAEATATCVFDGTSYRAIVLQ